MNSHEPDQAPDWQRACAGPAFITLRSERWRLVRVLLGVYLVCYLGLAILCGFARGLMGVKVIGPLNLGYTLIIANYAVAWGLAVIYVRISGRRHDALAAAAIAEHGAAGTGLAA